MTITLHLIRHAQGYHNLSIENHALRDPLLTDFGREQCVQLGVDFRSYMAKNFPSNPNITHLCTSPLRRAIYTALYAFEKEIEEGLTIHPCALGQEITCLPCDKGSDVAILKEEFKGNGKVDLEMVGEDWNSEKGIYEPAVEAIEERAKEVRKFMRGTGRKLEGNGDVHLVGVTHGAFLHYLTGDWHEATPATTGWKNTEFRSYQFVNVDDEEAEIREVGVSRERRGLGKGKTLKGEEWEAWKGEQIKKKKVVEEGWLETGWIWRGRREV